MILNVNVTQQHINTGIPFSGRMCPIANALRDCNPGSMRKVAVGPGNIFYVRDGRWFSFTTPSLILDFMRNFDKVGPNAVEPFSFTLDEAEAEFDLEDEDEHQSI